MSETWRICAGNAVLPVRAMRFVRFDAQPVARRTVSRRAGFNMFIVIRAGENKLSGLQVNCRVVFFRVFRVRRG
jgi:hypothetical protein